MFEWPSQTNADDSLWWSPKRILRLLHLGNYQKVKISLSTSLFTVRGQNPGCRPTEVNKAV